jgi:hypothetical protein
MFSLFCNTEKKSLILNSNTKKNKNKHKNRTKTYNIFCYYEQWMNKREETHRVDGPAIIWTNGQEFQEKWYINGKLHRLNGPALISYKNAIIVLEYWFINGRFHRTSGPAILDFDDNGKIEKELWLIDGKVVDETIIKKQ